MTACGMYLSAPRYTRLSLRNLRVRAACPLFGCRQSRIFAFPNIASTAVAATFSTFPPSALRTSRPEAFDAAAAGSWRRTGPFVGKNLWSVAAQIAAAVAADDVLHRTCSAAIY
ncbi:hypothetical protein BpHYR1_029178 [Brachionus plicatilis]|uniref:Uncharacterized protein n=1 Tax=Brachionus plicatilis TaxID=10195 RepID=A0A3M7T4G2_BRAPC|nr:hypothetical protein BpHYR1_029178 [Brachionus plicatilis]